MLHKYQRIKNSFITKILNYGKIKLNLKANKCLINIKKQNLKNESIRNKDHLISKKECI